MDMMMMDNSMGGPLMMGTWYNPKTGDSFTVRDTFFEDNNLIVMTTDGRRMDYNMVSQYVKSDKPIPKQIQQIPCTKHSLPPEVQNEIDIPDDLKSIMEEDKVLMASPNTFGLQYTSTYSTNTTPMQNAQAVQAQHIDEDTLLINRMLKKVNKPTVKCTIDWQGFPSRQLEMLAMMSVEPEKIAEFFAQSVDLESLRKTVVEQITQFITNSNTEGTKTTHEEVISVPFCQIIDDIKAETLPEGDTCAESWNSGTPVTKVASKPNQYKDKKTNKKKCK